MNTATEHTFPSTSPIYIHIHTHIQDVHPRTQRYATTCQPRGAQEPVSHSCSCITRVKRALMLRSPAGNDADEFRASLSASSDKKVPRNKPDVKPPLSGVSMNKLYVPFSLLILQYKSTRLMTSLTYMVLGLALLAAFYTWRFTVWAAQAGGYWNLLSGRTVPPKSSIADTASMASAAASTASAGYAVRLFNVHFLPEPD